MLWAECYLSLLPLGCPLPHVLTLRLSIFRLPGPFCGALPALLHDLPLATAAT